jgi:hypothetical protein
MDTTGARQGQPGLAHQFYARGRHEILNDAEKDQRGDAATPSA